MTTQTNKFGLGRSKKKYLLLTRDGIEAIARPVMCYLSGHFNICISISISMYFIDINALALMLASYMFLCLRGKTELM